MKVLVYSDNAEIYCDSLNGVGHNARPLWQNDIITNVANYEPCDCIIYDLRGEPVLPHDQVFKEIAPNRIIVIGKREDPLIPFLAGLGVRDFLFPPINPEDIVFRVENPATPTETAELLKTIPGLQPERIIQIIETAPPVVKKGFLRTQTPQENIVITTDVDDDEEDIPLIQPEKSVADRLNIGDIVGAVGDTVTIGFNFTRIVIATTIIAVIITSLLYGTGIALEALDISGGLSDKIIGLKAILDRGWQGWI